eukprot:6391503-Amphidinium_carterae.1
MMLTHLDVNEQLDFIELFLLPLVAHDQRKGEDTFLQRSIDCRSAGHGIELHAVALQRAELPFQESVAIKKTIGVEDFAFIALAVT